MRSGRSREQGGSKPSLVLVVFAICCIAIFAATSADRLLQFSDIEQPNEYDVVRADSNAPRETEALFQATNSVQKMNAYFGASGISLVPQGTGTPAWQLGLSLSGVASDTVFESLAGAIVSSEATSVGYSFLGSALSSDFTNTATGLAQRFVLNYPLDRDSSSTRIDLALSGNLTPIVGEGGRITEFATAEGKVVVRDELLRATDSLGQSQPVEFQSSGDSSLSIVVETSGATFPVTIESVLVSIEGTSHKVGFSPLAGFDIASVIGTHETKVEPEKVGESASLGASLSPDSFAQGLLPEVEPNGTPATATPLGGNNVVAVGNLFPVNEQDYWSFTANAGDRVYAVLANSFSAGAATTIDTQLRVFASNGTTELEFDDDDGFLGFDSTIAGTIIPSAGTYYLRVNHFGTTSQVGSPGTELEFAL